ncbi:MAG: acyl carrier protein [Deltaproteobacteria bacterium]|nr:acyl carrier protein [Deltaproteobacteria bacterium]
MEANQSHNLDEKILRVIAELSLVRLADIKPTDRLREDLGMDSVASMELLSALAEEFDLEVEMEEAMAITTVDGVMEMAKKRLLAA